MVQVSLWNQLDKLSLETFTCMDNYNSFWSMCPTPQKTVC